MEKKILYICVILLSLYVIYLNLTPTRNQKLNLYNQVLKECIDIEDANKGKTITNTNLFDAENNLNQLHNVLDTHSSEYFLIIVTSLETCNKCREQILELWNSFYKQEKDIPIFLIISEEKRLTREDRRKIKANLRGLKVEIPFFVEQETLLLNDFSVSTVQTPLSVILSHDKKIIAIDKASELTKVRSLKFRDYFHKLNSL